MSKNQEEYLKIIAPHKQHLTSVGYWNTYRIGKELPHSQTLIKHFGSWNALKNVLSLEQNSQSRPVKYTDEELVAMLEKYKGKYTSASEWDLFAEGNNLPKHYLFLDRLGAEELQKHTGIVLRWKEDSISDAILRYFPDRPPTTQEWLLLSKVEKVPSKMTIIRHFSSWDEMKKEIYTRK